MSTVPRSEPMSVAAYLAAEEHSEIKNEYVNGRVFAMAGATNAHNRVASRALVALGRQLDGSPCEAFNSDTKVRIQHQNRSYFYYPDVLVVCESNPDQDSFQDQPVVIVEVISESTRRVDEIEKRDHYLAVPSLDTYILLEQDQPVARVFQRQPSGEFLESAFIQPDSAIPLPSINSYLRFADIY